VKVKQSSSMLEEEKGYKSYQSKDDENFEEPPEQRAIPRFLQKIPGITVSPSDSLGYRIEALRLYLESVLGDVPFIASYKHLVVSMIEFITFE